MASLKIDIVDRACDAIDASGILGSKKAKLRPFIAGEEGVIVRRVPSTVVASYMDGRKDVNYLFAIYSRFKDEEQAITTALACADAVAEGNMNSHNSSYELSDIDVYSDVTDVDHSNGLHTYVIQLVANITTV